MPSPTARMVAALLNQNPAPKKKGRTSEEIAKWVRRQVRKLDPETRKEDAIEDAANDSNKLLEPLKGPLSPASTDPALRRQDYFPDFTEAEKLRDHPDPDPFTLKPPTGNGTVAPIELTLKDWLLGAGAKPSLPERSAPRWDEVRPSAEDGAGHPVTPPTEWRKPVPADNSDQTEEGDSSARTASLYPSENYLSALEEYLRRTG